MSRMDAAIKLGQDLVDKGVEGKLGANLGKQIVGFAGDIKNFGVGVFKYGFLNTGGFKNIGKNGFGWKAAKEFLQAGGLKGTGGHVGLVIGVGALAATLYSFASGLRTGKEGMDALKMRNNHMGSIWWSGAQTTLHGATVASIAGMAVFAPALLFAMPLIPILPSVAAIGMDYFQDVCTNPNNFINKAGQFGLNNAMLDFKNNDGSLRTFLPKAINFWEDNIRKKDESIARWFGWELDRPDLLLPSQGVRPGWVS